MMFKLSLPTLVISLILIPQLLFAQYNFKESLIGCKSGKLMKMPYESSGGEKGISIFEYDNNGKLKKSIWKLLNNSRSSVNFYTYDEQGNIIKKYREFSDNLTSTEHFTYDDNNRLISEEFKRSDGVTTNHFYTYNESDQLIVAKLENYHGWLDGKINYEYSENGLISGGKILQNGSEIGKITFIYNNQNELIKEHWEFWGSYSQTFNFVYAYEK